MLFFFFFFFQAEDGIRAFHVTGVQTCALPIFRANEVSRWEAGSRSPNKLNLRKLGRSEERRVGKGVDLGGRRNIKKKKKDKKRSVGVIKERKRISPNASSFS